MARFFYKVGVHLWVLLSSHPVKHCDVTDVGQEKRPGSQWPRSLWSFIYLFIFWMRLWSGFTAQCNPVKIFQANQYTFQEVALYTSRLKNYYYTGALRKLVWQWKKWSSMCSRRHFFILMFTYICTCKGPFDPVRLCHQLGEEFSASVFVGAMPHTSPNKYCSHFLTFSRVSCWQLEVNNILGRCREDRALLQSILWVVCPSNCSAGDYFGLFMSKFTFFIPFDL